jgi:hypothetical protein
VEYGGKPAKWGADRGPEQGKCDDFSALPNGFIYFGFRLNGRSEDDL